MVQMQEFTDHPPRIKFSQTGKTWKQLRDMIIKKHEPIKSSFFKSNTFSVMHIDAQIAEYIINHFTGQGIPVLAIHDSFLIDQIIEGDLRSVMETACNTISLKLFSQSIKQTKVGYEGSDLTGFTHLIRTDRAFYA